MAAHPWVVRARGLLRGLATNRLVQFSVDGGGRIWRSEVAHGPWRFGPAAGSVAAGALAAAAGVVLPDGAPTMHFSARQDVRGWLPERP